MDARCRRCGEPALDPRELIVAGRALGLRVDEAGTIFSSPTEAVKANALDNRKGFQCAACRSVYCMSCLLQHAPSAAGGGKACPACGGKFMRLPASAPAASPAPVPTPPQPSKAPANDVAEDTVVPTASSTEAKSRAALEQYDIGLGNLCKCQGNKSALWYGDAARAFTRAIELDPTLSRAYELRAACYARTGEVELAEADLKQAIQTARQRPPPTASDRAEAAKHVRAARHGVDTGGLISQTLFHLYKAIDADPNMWQAYDLRSDVYSTVGMADEAIRDIERAGKLKRASSPTDSARLPAPARGAAIEKSPSMRRGPITAAEASRLVLGGLCSISSAVPPALALSESPISRGAKLGLAALIIAAFLSAGLYFSRRPWISAPKLIGLTLVFWIVPVVGSVIARSTGPSQAEVGLAAVLARVTLGFGIGMAIAVGLVGALIYRWGSR